ncbi:DUF4190 domain-containing protein [Nonomuraea sp. NPDC004702]
MAITSLIFGVAGVVFICLYGFPGLFAVLFGHMARAEVRAGRRRGDGLAVAGLVLGYLAVSLAVAFLIYSANH